MKNKHTKLLAWNLKILIKLEIKITKNDEKIDPEDPIEHCEVFRKVERFNAYEMQKVYFPQPFSQ